MSREAFDPLNAEQTSRDLKEGARAFTSKIKDKASQFGNSVSETIGQQKDNTAGGLERMASGIHENADSLATGGQKAAGLAHSVATGMESTAAYLRKHDFKDMGGDVMGVCRRHPVETILSAVAVGFLVGRAVRR